MCGKCGFCDYFDGGLQWSVSFLVGFYNKQSYLYNMREFNLPIVPGQAKMNVKVETLNMGNTENVNIHFPDGEVMFIVKGDEYEVDDFGSITNYTLYDKIKFLLFQ